MFVAKTGVLRWICLSWTKKTLRNWLFVDLLNQFFFVFFFKSKINFSNIDNINLIVTFVLFPSALCCKCTIIVYNFWKMITPIFVIPLKRMYQLLKHSILSLYYVLSHVYKQTKKYQVISSLSRDNNIFISTVKLKIIFLIKVSNDYKINNYFGRYIKCSIQFQEFSVSSVSLKNIYIHIIEDSC